MARGIVFHSPAQTATVFESGNDIGGSSAETGNTITFGISNSPGLAYTGGTIPAGVSFRNVVGNSVRFNTISSETTLSLACGGIISTNATDPVGITYTSNFSNNTITLTNVGSVAITGIDFGSGLSTGEMIASNNTITINQNSTAANAATLTGIKANYPSATNTLNSNDITINQNPVTAGEVTSPVTGINAAGAGTTVNVNSNTIRIKQSEPGGTATFGLGAVNFIDTGAASGTVNVNSNQLLTTGSTIRSTGNCIGVNHDAGTFSVGITIDQNTINIDRTAATGTISGTYESTTPLTFAHMITNNSITFTNLAGLTDANGVITLGGVRSTGAAKSINSNTINITGTSTGTMNGIQTGYSHGEMNDNSITVNTKGTNLYGIMATTGSGAYTLTGNSFSLTTTNTSPTTRTAINCGATGPYQIFDNTFLALNCTGITTLSPVVTAIAVTAGNGNNIYNNTITNMAVGTSTFSGSQKLHGIYVSGGESTNIYRNKIYGLSTAASGNAALISGISIVGGVSNTIYNNLVGDLNAPVTSDTDAVRGISIESSLANSTNKVYFNTIRLASTSTGANFGTSGVYHKSNKTPTTSTLDLRNNIIVNKSTAKGTGKTVAYKRSSGTANNLSNYASTSDNNLFYAGTPGASNLIYFDGTSAQTINDYKNGVFTAGTVAPRDANSITEDVAFLSVTGSSADFLHIDPSVQTHISSGAQAIEGMTDDYNGNLGSAIPDIGADEFDPSSASGAITSPTLSSYSAILSLSNPGGVETSPSSFSDGATFTVLYFESGRTGMVPEGVMNLSPYYWLLRTNASTFNVTVRFYFNQIAWNGIGDYSALRLYKRTGTGAPWTEITTGITKTKKLSLLK